MQGDIETNGCQDSLAFLLVGKKQLTEINEVLLCILHMYSNVRYLCTLHGVFCAHVHFVSWPFVLGFRVLGVLGLCSPLCFPSPGGIL